MNVERLSKEYYSAMTNLDALAAAADDAGLEHAQQRALAIEGELLSAPINSAADAAVLLGHVPNLLADDDFDAVAAVTARVAAWLERHA